MDVSEANFNIDYDGEDFTIDLNGTNLLGHTWKPEGTPRFVYIFVHGLGAFVTFKKDFFYIILEQGGVVFGCDHLGHGRSDGPRVSCTMDEIVEENVRVVNLAHEKYPDLPIVIHGHSMGGCATILTIMKRWEEIKGKVTLAILEAPWISKCPQRELGRFERFGINLLHKIWPTKELPAGVALFSPDLHPGWVELCDKSPLYSHTLTPRLYLSVEEAHAFVRENIDRWPAELPLLFIQGANDALVDPQGNDEWIKALQAREGLDITYKLYDDVPHVPLKCPKRKEIIEDILKFLNDHLH